MNPTYPNLELLEYKALECLNHKKEFLQKITEIRETNKWARPYFDVIVFSQTWGSTCTGFDIMEDGYPTIGGSAMTKEYTSVFHELVTDTYVVFFGNRPCYAVDNPTENFFQDLKNHNLASLSEAKKKY